MITANCLPVSALPCSMSRTMSRSRAFCPHSIKLATPCRQDIRRDRSVRGQKSGGRRPCPGVVECSRCPPRRWPLRLPWFSAPTSVSMRGHGFGSGPPWLGMRQLNPGPPHGRRPCSPVLMQVGFGLPQALQVLDYLQQQQSLPASSEWLRVRLITSRLVPPDT